MKKFKRTVPMYSFYDRTGIQNYLETQAAKGWMLDKAGTVCWRFRRCAPRKLKFSVVYFPEADLYDPAPGEGEQTFREYCEHSGWHFVGSQAQMQIFYSEWENPVPIDTDPVIEVENIHKSMKKSLLPGYWALMVSSIIWIVNVFVQWNNDPLRYLSANLTLYLTVFWPSMFLLCTGRIIAYHVWFRKAKHAAENGEFLDSRGFQKIEMVWAIFAVVGMIGCLLFGRSEVTSFAFIFGVIVGALLLLVEYITRQRMKKKGYDAAESKVRTIVVTLVATLILSIVVSSAVFNVMEWVDDDRHRELYIELSDLMDVEYSTLYLEDTESILLRRQRITHYTKERPITELQYQVLHVKADFLYDQCREWVLSDDLFELVPIDSAPWGAVEAYEAWRNDQLKGYELCYEDCIVCIWPDWEMTAEQMAAIGNIFN